MTDAQLTEYAEAFLQVAGCDPVVAHGLVGVLPFGEFGRVRQGQAPERSASRATSSLSAS
jgi:hypothetical protein